MTDTLKGLQEVRGINSTFPYTTPIKAWKEQGGKAIGTLCNYVPEEIIHAAGILPIRLTGDPDNLDLEEANAYIYINACSFIRSGLELVLKKEYHFLDGFVTGNTCDPICRLTDIWRHYKFTPFVHILDVPRKMNELAHERYLADVRDFKHRLEEFFGVEISDQALRQSIKLYNRTRELLKQLYELRKSDTPPITGAEVLEVLNASFRMPREQFNDLLERLVEEASSGKRKVEGKFRLMVNGSPLTNPEFMKTLEELGGLVVVDELCTGVRVWWDLVDTNPELDPLEAISRRYLNNFPCARMYPSEGRFDRVLQIVKDYRVDGVVTEMVRYCVACNHDQPLLSERLGEEQGVPNLQLDLEYGMPGTGQIRTRVQAFLEMLEGRVKK